VPYRVEKVQFRLQNFEVAYEAVPYRVEEVQFRLQNFEDANWAIRYRVKDSQAAQSFEVADSAVRYVEDGQSAKRSGSPITTRLPVKEKTVFLWTEKAYQLLALKRALLVFRSSEGTFQRNEWKNCHVAFPLNKALLHLQYIFIFEYCTSPCS
jgi:hypothetical protein